MNLQLDLKIEKSVTEALCINSMIEIIIQAKITMHFLFNISLFKNGMYAVKEVYYKKLFNSLSFFVHLH